MWYGFNKGCISYFCFINNINVDEMCQKYKLNIDIIEKFLNDDKSLTINELNKIAEILNVNLIELFKEDDVPGKILKLN